MQPTSIVADDVRASRELVARWLAEKDYESSLVENGDEAWKAVNEDCPDLVVTDIEMPGKSGLELLRQIRAHPDERVRSIPVVVITSLCDAVLSEVVLGLGATTVLSKPLSKSAFQASIEQIHNREIGLGVVLDSVQAPKHSTPGPISPTLRRLIDQVRRQCD